MAGLSVWSDRPIRRVMDESPTQVRGFCLRFGSSMVSPRGSRGIWRLGVAAVVCAHPRWDYVSSPAFGSICLLSLRHDEISTLGFVPYTYITINHASFHAPYFLDPISLACTIPSVSPTRTPLISYSPKLPITPTISIPPTHDWTTHSSTPKYRQHARHSTHEGHQGWVQLSIPYCTGLRQVCWSNPPSAACAYAPRRCRSKKIRCDGIRPSCSQCTSVGFECKTSDKLSRRAFPRGYTESLEERVRSLEAEVRELKELLDEKDEKIDMLSKLHSASSQSAFQNSPRRPSVSPAAPSPNTVSEDVFQVQQTLQLDGNGTNAHFAGNSSGKAFYGAVVSTVAIEFAANFVQTPSQDEYRNLAEHRQQSTFRIFYPEAPTSPLATPSQIPSSGKHLPDSSPTN